MKPILDIPTNAKFSPAGHPLFEGTVTRKQLLNSPSSNKETFHIEISFTDNVVYEPGDALGICPTNTNEDITSLLQLFNEQGNRELVYKERHTTLFQLLATTNIRTISKKTTSALSDIFGVQIEEEKTNLIALLQKYAKPDNVHIEDILPHLSVIAPRLYSISSSPIAHKGQIHLTVVLHTFIHNNETKIGLASTYLAHFEAQGTLEFFIHKSRSFKIPANTNAPMIMIGPGTGIAPFRGFIAHREATGAKGKNWLFFGDQHEAKDFYYSELLQKWLANGVLTKLDTAFSRDQQEKIYVQHRIKDNGKLLVQWLGDGAYIFICGQRNPMSVDVEQALIEVISQEKNIPTEEAKSLLKKMSVAGRYQKDVY